MKQQHKQQNPMLKVLIASLMLICSAKTFAISSALEFAHNAKAAIRVRISETAPTRISFGGYQIKEVVGDENKYKIITDSNGMNVFITPKVARGTIVPMTIIAGSNKVQDLLLEVSSDEKLPRSVIIAPALSKKEGKGTALGTGSAADVSEAELMLRAMMEDENPHDKYYVTSSCRKLVLPNLPKLLIMEDKTWRYRNLTGASLVITNKGKVAVNLQGKYLRSMFKGVKLTVIEETVVGKGDTVRAFVISETEDD